MWICVCVLLITHFPFAHHMRIGFNYVMSVSSINNLHNYENIIRRGTLHEDLVIAYLVYIPPPSMRKFPHLQYTGNNWTENIC